MMASHSPPFNHRRLSLSNILSPPETVSNESVPQSSPFSRFTFSSPPQPVESQPPLESDITMARTKRVPKAPKPPTNSSTLISPPISPEQWLQGQIVQQAEPQRAADPVLFPSDNVDRSNVQGPLFPAAQSTADPTIATQNAVDQDTANQNPGGHINTDQTPTGVHAAVDSHIARRSSASTSSSPTKKEYIFFATVVEQFKKNPVEYINREWMLLSLVGRNPREGRREMERPRSAISRSKKPRASASSGVKKSRASRPSQRAIQPRPASQRNRGSTSPRTFHSAPPPRPRTPKTTTKDDSAYWEIVDFSPPISTLAPGNPRALPVQWSGQPLDLSNDSDRGLLHEAELHLAATLRLSCATYLTQKRRLFDARVRCLRVGKEFRKTDAQQECKIDVNKASRLWTAYDKAGWLAPHHFERFL